MRHVKRIIALGIAVMLIATICVVSFAPASASGTGAGLAEWAMGAYNNKWKYVYGGSSAGAVDCSGLIYSYCGGARTGSAQLASSTASGSVSAGIPRIHGLGLTQPGHTGVYVGNGMAVDARNEYYGVCYQSVATKAWTQWFKVAAVTYPTTGWVKFCGNYYYYEDGQYVVSCSRTIGGETYTFAASGISNKTPSDLSAVANNNSNASSNTNNNKPAPTKKPAQSTYNNTNNTQAQRPNVPKVLKIGSSGNRVVKLQNRLTELGFYSAVVTGYFGEATESAYKAFQKAAGVTVDGIAGKSDLKILYSSSAPKATRQEEQEPEETEHVKDKDTYQIGDQSDEIVKIQQKLTELNYFNQDCTGYYGDLTSIAVIAFQNANDLEATGICDKKTYDALFASTAVENPVFTTPVEEETQETTETVEVETEPETVAESVPEQIETQPVYNEVQEAAQENIEAVQSVVLTSNKVAKKAFAKVSDIDEKPQKLTVTQKNTNFMLWMGLVAGIVLLVGTAFLTVNKHKNKYVGAHSRGRKKSSEVPVRYW